MTPRPGKGDRDPQGAPTSSRGGLELTDRHLVLLFHTTHETMHADSVLKAHRMRFKLIPRPRDIRDDCGLGVVIHREDRERVESLFPSEEIYAKAAFRIEKDGTWIREDYPPAPISYGSPPSGSTSP